MASEKLEKKLGVWGIDKIFRDNNQIFAEDYYCVPCYEKGKKVQAKSFVGLNDPDAEIKTPECKNCVNEFYIEIWKYMSEHPLE